MEKQFNCKFCKDFETDYREVLEYHWEFCDGLWDLAEEAERN